MTIIPCIRWAICLTACLITAGSFGFAADITEYWITPLIDRQEDKADEKTNDVVVAKVNSAKIYKSQLLQQLVRTVGVRPTGLTKEQDGQLQASALQQLVGQQIVVEYLKSKSLAATNEEIELEIERLRSRAESVGKTFEEVLKESGNTVETLKQTLRWQRSWGSYLESQMTDENMKRVFARNKRLLDGTQLKVAQLFLKPKDMDDPESWAATIEKADELVEKIKSGSLEWDDAVREFSEAPSKSDGGEIGWIARDGTMPKSIVDAAFELEVGSISKPVRSNFGIHLLQVREAKSGSKTWQDCGDELKLMMAKQLFEWVQDQYKNKVDVEFTGAVPYFDPESGKLILD